MHATTAFRSAQKSRWAQKFRWARKLPHRRQWALAVLAWGLSLCWIAAPAGARAPSRGEQGMVVASEVGAAEAGRTMLARGGNAVDAAIATAFALGVTQPFSAGIGGGAFLLIRTADGQIIALDARETAPAAAHRDMYVQPGVPERASLFGPLAIATPGFVAGCAMALERWGTKPLAEVLQPAIALARDGVVIGRYHAGMLGFLAKRGLLERFPETARVQLDDGAPPEPGWRLVQADLARTLETIAAEGPAAFYTGALAEAMVADVQKRGGILTLEDLAGYAPALREAVSGEYRTLTVHSFPPPSSGGIALIEALNILEGFPLSRWGSDAPTTAHHITEAMKLAFADRAAFLGDPDFVDVPTERLISKDYAAGLRRLVDPPWWRQAPWNWGSERALTVPGPGLGHEDAGTTHLSTSDDAGNAVALTMTINTPFGSGITVPGTGIIMNNEMDDFSVATDTPNAYGLVDTRGANAVAPKKRPLSSMTPTILEQDGRLFLVTGSPGGPRIISSTLHSVLNVVDFGMNVADAVAAPRYHHQWEPNKVRVEPDLAEEIVAGLRERGHEVDVSSRRWSAVEAIVIDATGVHWGGNDPRRDGLAAGFPAEDVAADDVAAE
ncbi:MAG: gamma-glutamyltransferase [Myxococcota bacterium]